MTIRTLDCAPMSPWFPRRHLGALCLLVDTDRGLVFVDTGLGLHDYVAPAPLVRLFRLALRILLDPKHAAPRQLSRLGQRPEVVQQILMTHLHFDHAGGLPDSPARADPRALP
jgi:glyoxylase-like metal-dependent hydrolase (beta-lactamase superfamily II)